MYKAVWETALVTDFAGKADKEELIPRRVFWIMINGGESGVGGSLAVGANRITRKGMNKRDRRNAKFVIAGVKQALSQSKGH